MVGLSEQTGRQNTEIDSATIKLEPAAKDAARLAENIKKPFVAASATIHRIIANIIDPAAKIQAPEIVLARTDGTKFENALFNLRMDGGKFEFNSTAAKPTSFKEMSELRSNPENGRLSSQTIKDSLSSEPGLSLSNVGVSAVITTSVNGEQYAVLRCRKDGRFGPITGYLDSQQRSTDTVNTRKWVALSSFAEASQEIIVATPKGELVGGAVKLDEDPELLEELRPIPHDLPAPGMQGGIIPFAAPYNTPGINYALKSRWLLEPSAPPSFLPGLAPGNTVSLDGDIYNASMQFIQPWRCAQVISSYELTLPAENQFSLFSAEDALDKDAGPGMLKSTLDPNGIVLFHIGDDGFLDGKTFWYRNGELVECPRDPSTIVFSEAFAPSTEIPGRITVKEISFPEYRKTCSPQK